MSLAGRPSKSNGNGKNQNVPPDIVWDENNPPFIYSCSGTTEHDTRCNGECGGEYYTENEVKLTNLAREFARNKMVPYGIIKAYAMAGVPPTQGMQVDPFDVLLWMETLLEVLSEAGVIDRAEVEVRWQERKISAMEGILETIAPQLKQQRANQALGIVTPDNRLLGPNGQPL